MGPYCKYCDHRCFLPRILADHSSRIMATCPRGMAFDLESCGQTHETSTNPHDLNKWLELGNQNPWIQGTTDPTFDVHSFVFCRSLEELQGKLDRRFHSWCIGQAFSYGDLCFIQQVEGGDEWLTIRHGVAFESVTFERIITEGRFDAYVGRFLAATPEQCRNWLDHALSETPL